MCTVKVYYRDDSFWSRRPGEKEVKNKTISGWGVDCFIYSQNVYARRAKQQIDYPPSRQLIASNCENLLTEVVEVLKPSYAQRGCERFAI